MLDQQDPVPSRLVSKSTQGKFDSLSLALARPQQHPVATRRPVTMDPEYIHPVLMSDRMSRIYGGRCGADSLVCGGQGRARSHSASARSSTD